MDREKLLDEIMEHDFAVLDLRLYLDTHPADKEALSQYNHFMAQSRKYKAEFEKKYGPLSQDDMADENMFTWIDNPWPWEKTYLSQKPYEKGER